MSDPYIGLRTWISLGIFVALAIFGHWWVLFLAILIVMIWKRPS